ncbi:MAG: hypothetical protein M1378_05060 [Bacteroidetes bacterium]|jgi:hypothetical protein|nr:hypothetical protein [Bacteroidota bacterium]
MNNNGDARRRVLGSTQGKDRSHEFEIVWLGILSAKNQMSGAALSKPNYIHAGDPFSIAAVGFRTPGKLAVYQVAFKRI